MYQVMRYNPMRGGWDYMNSATTYGKACELMEELKRKYHGKYIIQEA